jgi:transposase InsO family protein
VHEKDRRLGDARRYAGADRCGRVGDGCDATAASGRADRAQRPRQYLSIRYTERLAEIGAQPSVGSVGDSYDNALAESIIGLYKAEVSHQQGPGRNVDAVEYATLTWVDWFNHRQLLESIGHVPPAEYERAYYRPTEGQAITA